MAYLDTDDEEGVPSAIVKFKTRILQSFTYITTAHIDKDPNSAEFKGLVYQGLLDATEQDVHFARQVLVRVKRMMDHQAKTNAVLKQLQEEDDDGDDDNHSSVSTRSRSPPNNAKSGRLERPAPNFFDAMACRIDSAASKIQRTVFSLFGGGGDDDDYDTTQDSGDEDDPESGAITITNPRYREMILLCADEVFRIGLVKDVSRRPVFPVDATHVSELAVQARGIPKNVSIASNKNSLSQATDHRAMRVRAYYLDSTQVLYVPQRVINYFPVLAHELRIGFLELYKSAYGEEGQSADLDRHISAARQRQSRLLQSYGMAEYSSEMERASRIAALDDWLEGDENSDHFTPTAVSSSGQTVTVSLDSPPLNTTITSGSSLLGSLLSEASSLSISNVPSTSVFADADSDDVPAAPIPYEVRVLLQISSNRTSKELDTWLCEHAIFFYKREYAGRSVATTSPAHRLLPDDHEFCAIPFARLPGLTAFEAKARDNCPAFARPSVYGAASPELAYLVDHYPTLFLTFLRYFCACDIELKFNVIAAQQNTYVATSLSLPYVELGSDFVVRFNSKYLNDGDDQNPKQPNKINNNDDDDENEEDDDSDANYLEYSEPESSTPARRHKNHGASRSQSPPGASIVMSLQRYRVYPSTLINGLLESK